MKTNKELNVENAKLEALNEQTTQLPEEDLSAAAGGFIPIPLRDDVAPGGLPNGNVITDEDQLPGEKKTPANLPLR